ncbi:reduced male fertility [Striga hermonthica]|uniref:Reduced male fertility n=1 Tax=Striga hermonthica TaxID=68872 RepID=A0A9N7P0G2_STRHE|nr:reduced male fertility [Striga hermonthica]
MGKRLDKLLSTFCCISPTTSINNSQSPTTSFSNKSQSPIFSWYQEDIWTEIAKYLDGRSLVMLAVTCKWFRDVLREDDVWKYACLRDFELPDPGKLATFSWKKLYALAFDGSHSYLFRHPEKCFEWKRIGAFIFHSSSALLKLTESLVNPLGIRKPDVRAGGLVLNNVKYGIWIAGKLTILAIRPIFTLNARHIELFLSDGFLDGSWDYEALGVCNINKRADGAFCGLFDIKHLEDRDAFNESSVGPQRNRESKAMLTLHAVALRMTLEENEGLQIKYHAMKSGKDGQIVAIRISNHFHRKT